MDEIKSSTPIPTSRCRLLQGAHSSKKDTRTSSIKKTSIQPSPTRWYGGRTITKSQWHEIRCGVWFLASEIVSLDDLQLFAETVEPTDPLDIKTTAEILAKAQLELRDYHNNR